MDEKIELFNQELERVGITKDDLWIMSVWKNQATTAQGDYKSHVIVKLINAGYSNRINSSGMVTLTHPENTFEFTFS
jgi:hypothetical protein